MIYPIIDYFVVSSFVLLIAVALWRSICQPVRRVLLARVVFGLLLICVSVIAWPNRFAISPIVKITTAPLSEKIEKPHQPFDAPRSNQPRFYDEMRLPRAEPLIRETPAVQTENNATETAPVATIATEQPQVQQRETVPAKDAKRFVLSTLNISTAIIAIYVSGAIVLGGWYLFGAARLFWLVKKSKSAPPEVVELLQRFCGNMRSVRVIVNKKLAAPIAFGTIRPGIILPTFLCDNSVTENKHGLEFALAHELSHIRSGDLWVLMLSRILALVLYPNPLFWLLLNRMREEQEILADAAATTLANAEDQWEIRYKYALELVRWSRLAFASTSPPTAIAALAICEMENSKQKYITDTTSLERRIDMLIQNETLSLKTTWLWKSCCILGIGSLMFVLTMFTLQPVSIVSAVETEQKKIVQENTEKDKPATREMKDAYDVADKIRATVLDENDKPVAGVELYLNIWGGDIDKTFREKIISDENGVVVFDMTPIKGKKFEPCRLWASAPGYIPLFVNWDRLSTPYRPIPDEFTIKMEKALQYSGQVVNEQGEPIEGVDINVVGPSNSSEPNKLLGAIWSLWLDNVKTDADGRWKSNEISKGIIRFGFKHPDYLDTEYGQYKGQDGMTPEKLLEGSAVYIMKSGIPVSGTVTDQDGNPIAGATVRIGSNDMINYSDNKAAVTDEHGKYLIYWKAGTCPIMVNAKDKAPELQMLTVTKNLEPVNFVLLPGKTIKVKVLDFENKPLEGIAFNPLRWRGTERYFDDKLKGNEKTDADGMWTWNEAPTDSVQFFVYGRGLSSEQPNYVFEPRDEPYTIRMVPLTKATGRVIDAKTKEPIPTFTINPGYRWSEIREKPVLQTSSSTGYRDGVFEYKIDRQNYGYYLRFTADGYIPYVTETFKPDENANITVELTPAEPISAMVVLPDGKPAEKAEVALFSSSTGIGTIWNGKLNSGDMRTIPYQITQADGHFTFQPQLDGYVIVISHDAGAALVYADDLKNGTVKLQPWSRVEGTVKKGNEPWPGKLVRVAAWLEGDVWDENRPEIQFIYSETSDANGKFVIEKIIPKRKIVAFWQENYGRTSLDSFVSNVSSDFFKFESEPGKTETIALGGVGRPVTGKINLTSEKYRDKIDWEFAELNLEGIPENISPPDYKSLPIPEGVDPNDSISFENWYYRWMSEGEMGQEFHKTARQYNEARPARRSCRIEKDGSFRVENVPAGRYEFSVSVFQPKPIDEIQPNDGNGLGRNIDGRLRLGNARREPIITVPNFNGTVTEIPADLGEVKIELWK